MRAVVEDFEFTVVIRVERERPQQPDDPAWMQSNNRARQFIDEMVMGACIHGAQDIEPVRRSRGRKVKVEGPTAKHG